jgi:hypothetical protein
MSGIYGCDRDGGVQGLGAERFCETHRLDGERGEFNGLTNPEHGSVVNTRLNLNLLDTRKRSKII